LGDWGRSEEKRHFAVSSKQKSTKNLFLVGSILRCWLAHSDEIYSYQPMIWRAWLVEKVGEKYCLREGKYFSSVNN
jgi:hypothetical protein